MDYHYKYHEKLGHCTDSRCETRDERDKYSVYMKTCMEFQTQGRLDKLFGMMDQHSLDFSRVVQGIWPLGTPFLDREGLLWHKAAAEEGLDPQAISKWGRVAPKFPRSWLPKLLGLSHEKKFRYNFQGGGMSAYTRYAGNYKYRRAWMTEFAKTHFDKRDFLRWTDVRPNSSKREYRFPYTPLGEFDYSGRDLPGGFIVRMVESEGKDDIYFDSFYFGTMAASEFTVAPGGDGPCTLRFYEAVAARSIPLVPEKDAPLAGCTSPYANIGYKFATDKNLFPYSEQIVEDNFKLLVQYQTFTRGDNVPLAIKDTGWIMRR